MFLLALSSPINVDNFASLLQGSHSNAYFSTDLEAFYILLRINYY